MTAVDEATDLEIIESLDFDPELACEVKHMGGTCGKPASCVARLKCCGHSHLMCNGCVEFWKSTCDGAHWIKCGFCKKGMAPTFERLVELIPIGSKS